MLLKKVHNPSVIKRKQTDEVLFINYLILYQFLMVDEWNCQGPGSKNALC